MRLHKLITELNEYLKQGDQLNKAVSNRGTYWHADHIMRVIAGSINQLYISDEKPIWTGLNYQKLHLFVVRGIPRGKFKAPPFVNSTEPISEETIQKRQRNVRFAVKLLPKIAQRQSFKHQVLGRLNKRQTIRFLEVHTAHHVRIIQEILG